MQKVDAARALYEELKYWADAGRIWIGHTKVKKLSHT
jgi:hypothetical protein